MSGCIERVRCGKEFVVFASSLYGPVDRPDKRDRVNNHTTAPKLSPDPARQ